MVVSLVGLWLVDVCVDDVLNGDGIDSEVPSDLPDGVSEDEVSEELVFAHVDQLTGERFELYIEDQYDGQVFGYVVTSDGEVIAHKLEEDGEAVKGIYYSPDYTAFVEQQGDELVYDLSLPSMNLGESLEEDFLLDLVHSVEFSVEGTLDDFVHEAVQEEDGDDYVLDGPFVVLSGSQLIDAEQLGYELPVDDVDSLASVDVYVDLDSGVIAKVELSVERTYIMDVDYEISQGHGVWVEEAVHSNSALSFDTSDNTLTVMHHAGVMIFPSYTVTIVTPSGEEIRPELDFEAGVDDSLTLVNVDGEYMLVEEYDEENLVTLEEEGVYSVELESPHHGILFSGEYSL